MDALWEMLAVFCLLVPVRAQETSNQQGVHTLHPSTAAVLITLSIMICVIFLIVVYGKFCYRPELHHQNEVQGPGWIIGSSSRFSGINRAIVESLPFFRFSSLKGSKAGLECAVCLSMFEDTEILRLLPRCQHAFHMDCIDKWLENHSSCPLCRYRFDAGELGSLFTNSYRNLHASLDEPNLEFYIQREESERGSSRFNLVNTFQNLARGRKEEPLIREFSNKNNDGKLLHSVRHKVIVSDVMFKSRWSDVNSLDLISLNSHMLDFLSSKRFSSVDQSVIGKFSSNFSGKEQILKIKEDIIERKRLYEYKVWTADEHTPSTSYCNDSDNEMEHISTLKALDPNQKRSMSEITNIPRFKDRFAAATRANGSPTASNKDDSVRRLWIPIARRTVQWFAGREKSSDARKSEVDV